MTLLLSPMLSACGSLYLGKGVSMVETDQGRSPLPVSAADCARQPVIVVPGIMGSTLFDQASQTRVWGTFVGAYADPGTAAGLRQAALPMAPGTPLDALRDQIIADGLLQTIDFKLLGLIHAHADGYRHVVEDLNAVGYRIAPVHKPSGKAFYNAFIFSYDWRRDLVETARLLYDFVSAKQAYLAEHYARCPGRAGRPITFDLVTHSMGGLIGQYYLRYGKADLPADGTVPRLTWPGRRHIRRATLLAPPNQGCLRALLSLLKGRRYLPGTDAYPKAVIGTYPSVYMLMPHDNARQVVDSADTTRSVETLFDAALWAQWGWGLADPAEDAVLNTLLPGVASRAERRAIALDHLQKCLDRARQFNAAMDRPAPLPEGLRIDLILSEEIPTDARLAVNLTTGHYQIVARRPGDGRVLRASALGTAASSSNFSEISIVAGRHISMLKTAPVAHRISGAASSPPRRLPQYRFGVGLAALIPAEEKSGTPTLSLSLHASLLLPLTPWLKAGSSLNYWRFAHAGSDPHPADPLSGGAALSGPSGETTHFIEVSMPFEVHPQSRGWVTPFAGLAPGFILRHREEGEAAYQDQAASSTTPGPAAPTVGVTLTGTLGLRFALSSRFDLTMQTRFYLLSFGGPRLEEHPQAPLQAGFSFHF